MKRFASKLASWAPVVIVNVLGLAGLGSISYGTWLVYHPAGFIVGGSILTGTCYLLARRA